MNLRLAGVGGWSVSILYLGGVVTSLVLGPGLGAGPVPTLEKLAVFGPLGRRVQATVDRRFDRARYDAARTAGASGHRLRDEVDLETLTVNAERVVGATLQPATAWLWLRSAREARP